MKSNNAEVLASFVSFCKKNPKMSFLKAFGNWVPDKFYFIHMSSYIGSSISIQRKRWKSKGRKK